MKHALEKNFVTIRVFFSADVLSCVPGSGSCTKQEEHQKRSACCNSTDHSGEFHPGENFLLCMDTRSWHERAAGQQILPLRRRSPYPSRIHRQRRSNRASIPDATAVIRRG